LVQMPPTLRSVGKQLIPPRMIVQRGCTGSTAVMAIAKDLVSKLGVEIWPNAPKEMLRTGRPDKNPWYAPGLTLGDAVRLGVEKASGAGQIMLFNGYKIKSWSKDAAQVELQYALKELNTRTVIVHRNNSLDTLICEVRDCFASQHGPRRGYAVNQNGKRDNTCFERRHSSTGKPMAFINTENLLENLAIAESYQEEMQSAITELGFEGGEVVFFEDLTAHEYSAENLDRSTDAWSKFLGSLGIRADREAVKNILKEAVGTYHPPERHTEAIYNLDSVLDKLTSAEKGSLVRM